MGTATFCNTKLSLTLAALSLPGLSGCLSSGGPLGFSLAKLDMPERIATVDQDSIATRLAPYCNSESTLSSSNHLWRMRSALFEGSPDSAWEFWYLISTAPEEINLTSELEGYELVAYQTLCGFIAWDVYRQSIEVAQEMGIEHFEYDALIALALELSNTLGPREHRYAPKITNLMQSGGVRCVISLAAEENEDLAKEVVSSLGTDLLRRAFNSFRYTDREIRIMRLYEPGTLLGFFCDNITSNFSAYKSIRLLGHYIVNGGHDRIQRLNLTKQALLELAHTNRDDHINPSLLFFAQVCCQESGDSQILLDAVDYALMFSKYRSISTARALSRLKQHLELGLDNEIEFPLRFSYETLSTVVKYKHEQPSQGQSVVWIFATTSDHNSAFTSLGLSASQFINNDYFVRYLEVKDEEYLIETMNDVATSQNPSLLADVLVFAGHGSMNYLVFSNTGDEFGYLELQDLEDFSNEPAPKILKSGGAIIVSSCYGGHDVKTLLKQVFTQTDDENIFACPTSFVQENVYFKNQRLSEVEFEVARR